MRKKIFFTIFTLLIFTKLIFSGNLNLNKNFIRLDVHKPLEISSKTLVITEIGKNIYRFHYKTNVIAIQKDNKIYSDELIAIYDKNKKLLKKVTFIGNVKIKSKTTICSCNKAIYDPEADKIYLKGNIKILQDKNLFNGDEMILDLKNNTTILKGTSKRINTIFNTGGNVKNK